MKNNDAPVSSVLVMQPGHRFQLVRFFTITSLVAILLVAAVLVFFQQQQSKQLREMQVEEATFFAQAQKSFSKDQDEAARRDLLEIQEAGNVNLTRLFANALWSSEFAPFVQKVQQIPVEHCQAIADEVDAKTGKKKAPAEKVACFKEVGAQIRAIPGFDRIHAKVFDSMKKSSVFKIKVFDLRGITVYSSELAQVGEDKSTNAGWVGAAKQGTPKSELTHRDKFSAFEGTVENRDLISSYLPVLAPGSDRIVGVFEVYSDVTRFLTQIKATSDKINLTSKANEEQVEKIAEENQTQISSSTNFLTGILVLLLLGLFGALFYIVKRADAIITAQEAEREQAQQNLAQSEKMASLGQMVAGVAHQLNTPIAFSTNNVSMAIDLLHSYEAPLKVAARFADVVRQADGPVITLDIGDAKERISAIDAQDLDVSMPAEMLTDTLQGLDQMRELVDNLRDFTRLDRSKTAKVNLNKGLGTVVYLAKSVIPTHIKVTEDYAELPEIDCNISQLNQVFLNLVNNAAQAISGESGEVRVSTRTEGKQICVEVSDTGSGIPDDVLPHIWDNYFTTKKAGEGTGLGLPIAKTIVEEHGGTIEVKTQAGVGTTFTVRLPAAVQETTAA